MPSVAKIALIGHPVGNDKKSHVGPGCSSLLQRWTEGKFLNSPSSTIGVEFGSRMFSEDLKIQAWDTATAERFLPIVQSYLPGGACIVLVIDLATPGGYHALEPLFGRLPDFNKDNGAFIVIGAKADDAQSNNMSACREFVEGWNKSHPQYQTKFVACSALSGEGCEEAFKATVEIATSNGAAQIRSAEFHPARDGDGDKKKKKSSNGKLGGWGVKKPSVQFPK